MTVVASIEIAPGGSPGTGVASGTSLGRSAGAGKAFFAGKVVPGEGIAFKGVDTAGVSGSGTAAGGAPASFRSGLQPLLDSLDAALGAGPKTEFDAVDEAVASADSLYAAGAAANSRAASTAGRAAPSPDSALQSQPAAFQQAGSTPASSTLPQKGQGNSESRGLSRDPVLSSSARAEEKKSDSARSTAHVRDTGLASPIISFQSLPAMPLTAPVSVAAPLPSQASAPEAPIAAGEAVHSRSFSSGSQSVSQGKPTAVSSISSNPANEKTAPLASSLPSGSVGFAGFSAGNVSVSSEIARSPVQGLAGEGASGDLEAGNPSQRRSQAVESISNATGSVDVESGAKTAALETSPASSLIAPASLLSHSTVPAAGSPSITEPSVAIAPPIAGSAKPPGSSHSTAGATGEANASLSSVGRASAAGALEARVMGHIQGQLTSQASSQPGGQLKSQNPVASSEESLDPLHPAVLAGINPNVTVPGKSGSQIPSGVPSQTGGVLRPLTPQPALRITVPSSTAVQGPAGVSNPAALPATVAMPSAQILTSGLAGASFASDAMNTFASHASIGSGERPGPASSGDAGTGKPVALSGVQPVSSPAVKASSDSTAQSQSQSHTETGSGHPGASEPPAHSGSESRAASQNVAVPAQVHAVSTPSAHAAQDAAGMRGVMNPAGPAPGNPLPASSAALTPRAESRETFATLDGAPDSAPATWVHAGSSRAEAGFQDPNLGWVSVRADQAEGGIHATLVPGSAEAASALGSHLDGLNAYLADRHSTVQSVTVGVPDGRQSSGGAESGGQQGRGQDSGQDSGAASRQGFEQRGDSGFGVNAVSEIRSTSGGTSAQPAMTPALPLTGEFTGGVHISVVA